MNVFIGMECSGTIRRAFAERGHYAISCDLKSDVTESPSHRVGDVFEVLASYPGGFFDLAIFHPNCTYLSVSGYHWCYKDPTDYPNTICGPRRLELVERATADYMRCINADVKRIAVENPVGIMSSRYRKPDQYIQPYDFGEDASKRTGLHLKGLPGLLPTRRFTGRIVEWDGRLVERWSNQTDSGQNRLPPTPGRAAERAVTYPGWANAMASQWGTLM